VAADPTARLAELLGEVRRHQDAAREYRLSAYPEMADLHELKLRSLYAEIRRYCREHGLVPPKDIPRR